jgi:hypothetical protein
MAKRNEFSAAELILMMDFYLRKRDGRSFNRSDDDVVELSEILQRLRAPHQGEPWDEKRFRDPSGIGRTLNQYFRHLGGEYVSPNKPSKTMTAIWEALVDRPEDVEFIAGALYDKLDETPP